MVLSCVELQIADDPAAWTALGFAVDDDGIARVGQVDLRFVGGDARSDPAHGGPGRGIVGWTLAPPAGGAEDGPTDDDRAGADDALDLDGLPTRLTRARAPGSRATIADPTGALPTGSDPTSAHPTDWRATGALPTDGRSTGAHPNGVISIDHVVVLTPDLDRTTEALGRLGVDPRRTREAGRGRLQRFFRLGEVILELVGPAEPAGGAEQRPAAFFGLALTSGDLDATVAHLEGRIGDAKAAVQPGRRIATLRTGDEVSVPIAVMSPEPRRAAHGDARSGR